MPLAIGLAAISNRRGLGHRQRQPLSTSHFTPWRGEPTLPPPPLPGPFGGGGAGPLDSWRVPWARVWLGVFWGVSVASPIRCRRLRAAIGAQRKAHRAAHTERIGKRC